MPCTKVAIGIDLGTTKCCVGVVRDGRVEIVENERGNKTTPSYVAFTDTERLVGEDAKDQVTVNPANTVFGVKGLIGRNLDQVKTYCKVNRLPFEISALGGKPRIQVKFKGGERFFSPEQIVAMLLSKMKKLAESHLGCTVTDAVISVPAYFNNSQRLATIAAAEIAGLEVLRLINEPTAAALTFASNRRSKEREAVMMIDVGGGTLDASFMYISEDVVDVKSTQGDCHFGGQSLDVYLLDHFVEEFHKKHGKDLPVNKRAVERLRFACKEVKKTLSQLSKAIVQVDSLVGDIDFESSISRSTFDSLLDETIPQSLMPVLINAGLAVDREIDHVVLVGGSSRVPIIQTAVKDLFDKDITKTINVNEAVAFGATLHAALLLGENVSPNINVLDVTPHSIDLVPTTCLPVTIITNNMNIPFQNRTQGPSEGETSFTEFVSHSKDSQKEYNLLGYLDEDLEETQTGELLEIKYGINKDGIFFASVQSNEPNSTTNHVDACIQVVDKVQLQEMTKETNAIDQDQRRYQENLLLVSEMESAVFTLRSDVEKVTDEFSEGRKVMIQSCNEMLDWLDRNPNASKDEMKKEMSNLKEICDCIRVQVSQEDASTV